MQKRLFTPPRIIILFLLILMGVVAVWLGLRTAIVKGLTAGISNLEQQGFKIGHSGLSVTGFPFVIDARTQNVSVSAPTSLEISPYTNWSIKSEEIDLYSSTLTPFSWEIRHTGDIRVDMHGMTGERYMFDIAPATIIADVAVRLSGQLKNLDVKMSRARLNTVIGSVPPILQLDGARAQLNVQNNEAVIDLIGKNFILSDQTLRAVTLILGQTITRGETNVRIEGWNILEKNGATAWMQTPARIISDNWVIEWGSADMVGSFDIGFTNGKPEGVIRIKIKNVNPLLEKITVAGYISPIMTNQIMTLASGIDSDEDGRQLIELTIRNGVVKYGFIPLYEF